MTMIRKIMMILRKERDKRGKKYQDFAKKYTMYYLAFEVQRQNCSGNMPVVVKALRSCLMVT